eukprot:12939091-Prorocentrum_lima.AAC.1
MRTGSSSTGCLRSGSGSRGGSTQRRGAKSLARAEATLDRRYDGQPLNLQDGDCRSATPD